MSEDVELSLFLEYARRRLAFEYDDEEVGELAVRIIRTLLERGEAIPDENLALILGVSAVELRRVLHTMHKVGLIRLTRETLDQYRYEYKWSIDREFIRKFLIQHLEKVSSKLTQRIEILSSTTIYVCPTCYRGYMLDEAYEYDFKCPRDDTELVQVNASLEITLLANIIKNLKVEGKQ
ncbi:transcription factor TFIIE [Vulcanisaeta thermophila]|uniref:transcription factor TFIIE n=1 Tax=Vulcanisaeta thermophila TaxID=867917 RepID=UPI0008529180|nr:transcription factor TFIIE [Vulcanisaeta thermophila]